MNTSTSYAETFIHDFPQYVPAGNHNTSMPSTAIAFHGKLLLFASHGSYKNGLIPGKTAFLY